MTLLKFSNKEDALQAIKWAALFIYGIILIFSVFSLLNIRGEFVAVRIMILHYIFISLALVFLIRMYRSIIAAALLLGIQPILYGWHTFPLMLRGWWGLVLFALLIIGAAYTFYATIIHKKLSPDPHPMKDLFISKITNQKLAIAAIKVSTGIMVFLLILFLYVVIWTFLMAGLPLYLLVNFFPLFVLVIVSRWLRSRIAALLLVLTVGAWIMNITIDNEKLAFLDNFNIMTHWYLMAFFILALLVSIRLLQATIAFHRLEK